MGNVPTNFKLPKRIAISCCSNIKVQNNLDETDDIYTKENKVKNDGIVEAHDRGKMG